MPTSAIVISIAIGIVLCGVYGGFGAWALDRFRGGMALAAVAVAIMVASVFQLAVTILVCRMIGTTSAPGGLTTFFAINIGWLVGLFAGGFPRLVLASERTRATA